MVFTTILKASLSENDGFNIGDGSGSGTTNAGMSSNSNQNSGRNRGAGMNWQQSEAHVLKPQDIKNIRAGHGLAWVPGLGTKTIPDFAPDLFQSAMRPGCARCGRTRIAAVRRRHGFLGRVPPRP